MAKEYPVIAVIGTEECKKEMQQIQEKLTKQRHIVVPSGMCGKENRPGRGAVCCKSGRKDRNEHLDRYLLCISDGKGYKFSGVHVLPGNTGKGK